MRVAAADLGVSKRGTSTIDARSNDAGPLAGIRIVEFAEAGSVPFAAMVLADMGADIIRVERPGQRRVGPEWVTLRGRPAVALDLKCASDRSVALQLIERADALIEGFRPGVMERLGLGPEEAAACNPRLVYGRATGWGQTGPLAHSPGHDINYIAITGILDAIGEGGRDPVVPLNLLGDFAGGAMFLLAGLLAGLIEAAKSGQGQVIDSAMSEGASTLASFIHYMRKAGRWRDSRGHNLLDGGAPFYRVYECADGRHIAVGAIEPQFYSELRKRCNLIDPIFDDQHDRARWPEMAERMASVFRTRNRDEWLALLEGSDACVSPVLTWDEAADHPQNRARGAFVNVAGVRQPAPSPRFSRTPVVVRGPPPGAGEDGERILAGWGVIRP